MYRVRRAWLLYFAGAVGFFLALTLTLAAQVEAPETDGSPFVVAVLADLHSNRQFAEEIRRLVSSAEAEINRGGDHDHKIEVHSYDVGTASKETIKKINVLAKDKLLAVIGPSSLKPAKKDTETAGTENSEKDLETILREIAAAHVPLILHQPLGAVCSNGQFDRNSAFGAHRNVFSTRPSLKVERTPIIAQFILAWGYKRPTVLGSEGDPCYEAVRDGIRGELERVRKRHQILKREVLKCEESKHNTSRCKRLTRQKSKQDAEYNKLNEIELSEHTFKINGGRSGRKLTDEQLNTAVLELRERKSDLLILALDWARSKQIIERLERSQSLEGHRVSGPEHPYRPQIFLVDQIRELSKLICNRQLHYSAAIYDTVFGEIPDATSNVKLVVPQGLADAAATRKTAPACENSKATVHDGTGLPESPDADLDRAAYVDMILLVKASVAAAKRAATDGNASVDRYRQAVLNALGKTYVSGVGAFKGKFENWAFHRKSRTRAQTPFIVIFPTTSKRVQLQEKQFLRLRDHDLQSDGKPDGPYTYKLLETIYVNIVLNRIYDVDNSAKTFRAKFELIIRQAPNISIKDIDFSNAVISSDGHGTGNNQRNRKIDIKKLNFETASSGYSPNLDVYRVSGQFRFEPDFRNYPFDRQFFSIDLQPHSNDKPFVIQPVPPQLRDAHANSDGWLLISQPVLVVMRFLTVPDPFTLGSSSAPYIGMRIGWVMARVTTDYRIRVIVPLSLILLVAYLSVFIPPAHFEAIVTIQVTSLLSAVALYLSLPHVYTDIETLSDRIFMYDYVLTSGMIFISIVRINARVWRFQWFSDGLLKTLHIVLFPILLYLLYATNARPLMAFEQHLLPVLLGPLQS